MTKPKVDFSSVRWGSVEWTNLVTLYLRAYESRSRRPILGDHAAAEAVDRIDYDFKRIHRTSLPATNQYLVALRAKRLDDWCGDFRGAQRGGGGLIFGWGPGARLFGLRCHRRSCGSTSISQVSSSCGDGCTTTPSTTG